MQQANIPAGFGTGLAPLALPINDGFMTHKKPSILGTPTNRASAQHKLFMSFLTIGQYATCILRSPSVNFRIKQ